METPQSPSAIQANEDAQQLTLLAVFHYIFAALGTLFGCLAAAYFVFVGFFVANVIPSSPGGGGPPPAFLGWFVGAIGAFVCLWVLLNALLHFLCGRWLTQRRNRNFCVVAGCLSCINFPLGTVLGVFTVVVLARPSVRALFDQNFPGAYLNR